MVDESKIGQVIELCLHYIKVIKAIVVITW